jgi:2'-5' RNA ligase
VTAASFRRQATLFLPEPEGAAINALRSRVNPVQASLIAAHVTLCREDEVDDWAELGQRLAAVAPIDLTLRFGAPIRDGNLVLLPAEARGDGFAHLRHRLLARPGHEPRPMQPHITLIHPRNGTCTDAVFDALRRECLPFAATFRGVSIIEQRDGAAWTEVAAFGAPGGQLPASSRPD